MSIESISLLIKNCAKTNINAPANQQAQTANPFATSVFANTFESNPSKTSFNNNNSIKSIPMFNSNAGVNFGSNNVQNGGSIFNTARTAQQHPPITKTQTEDSDGLSELINLVKQLIEELKNNKNTESKKEPEAEKTNGQEKKEKKGGGFFGFIKDAVSTVAPIATNLLGGGGLGNIASGLVGKLFGA